MARVDEAGTNAEEENTILLILCVELGRDDVHGRLTQGVDRQRGVLVVIDPVDVSDAARDYHDLLDRPVEDLGHEEVVQVDVSDHVGLYCLADFTGKLFRSLTPVIFVRLV